MRFNMRSEALITPAPEAWRRDLNVGTDRAAQDRSRIFDDDRDAGTSCAAWPVASRTPAPRVCVPFKALGLATVNQGIVTGPREQKIDGWRMLAYKDGRNLRLVFKRPPV
jgi:hypothetical protein